MTEPMDRPAPDPGDGDGPRMPRWVRTSLIVLVVLVVVVIALLLTGEHGPSRHSASLPELPVGTAAR